MVAVKCGKLQLGGVINLEHGGKHKAGHQRHFPSIMSLRQRSFSWDMDDKTRNVSGLIDSWLDTRGWSSQPGDNGICE